MLHTVNKSPFEKDSLASCLRMIRPGSALIFIEDGVYAAVARTRPAKQLEGFVNQIDIFILRPDLEARGIAGHTLIEGIELVDYQGFVRLAAQHDKVLSWL